MAKIIILLQQFVSISNLCLKSYTHIQLNGHHKNWLISTNKLHLYVPFGLFPHGGQKFATVGSDPIPSFYQNSPKPNLPW